MSRNVRITAVAAPHMTYNGSDDMKALTEQAADYITGHIKKVVCEKNDLIVLPEVYDRYSGMSREKTKLYYEVRGNYVLEQVKKTAAENKVNIVFSSVLDGGDGYMRNRQVFIGRDGTELGIYDKNHLVWEEHTQSNIAFGKDPELINSDFGKMGGVICYDLNFDELREKYVKLKPELLVFSSMYHGGYVARNWAYTCRSFFVGCVQQRQSFVINPLGEVIAQSNPYTDYLTCDVNLDYVVAHLDYNMQKKQALKEKYGPLVNVEIPRGLGVMLITGKNPEKNAYEMAKEFDIELLDELFARGRKQRLDFIASNGQN